ncbi:MAG: hypothetical protein MN733_09975 [Nitrososphaera sp.]|nr:hypothetical protein [Nitrososphaera sp.]
MTDNIQINGVAVTDANFNDTTPVAGAGRENLLWQRSGSGPDSVSVQTSGSIPIVLDREVTDITILNTTTETTIFSHTVPANTMGQNKFLHLIIIGDLLQNSTATNGTVRIKFGGTIMWQDASGNFSADADRRGFFLDLWLTNSSATAVQIAGGFIVDQDLGSVPGPPTTGIAGNLDDADMAGTAIISDNGNADTTAAATLEVTWQWGAAGASTEFIRRLAILQLV